LEQNVASARILIADDDKVICTVLGRVVREMGHRADCVHTAADAIAAARDGAYDVALLDLGFPDCDDLSTLKAIREQNPDTDVLMVTASTDDMKTVSEAVGLGAFDYVPKPIRKDDIRIRLTRVLKTRSVARSQKRAVSELASGSEASDIVGRSAVTREIVSRIAEASSYDVPVLISGETGTGKELIARALHYGGPRRDRPFVPINCAALPQELTESELFGHERGAFTGAHATRRGVFDQAEDGTLFLDEVGDMNLGAQASMLQVLECGEYRSIGGKPKTTEARVLLATNQDLDALIRQGRFRRDLYYRVNRIRIHVPPLRKRKEDIDDLVAHFMEHVERKIGKGVHRLDESAAAALRNYSWPGNVRELRNEVERAYIHADGDTISVLDLSSEIVAYHLAGEGDEVDPRSAEDVSRLLDGLKATGWRIGRTAEMLGIHRNTVRRWMARFGLRAP
jgi:DNA-binding NtrC family response regulator